MGYLSVGSLHSRSSRRDFCLGVSSASGPLGMTASSSMVPRMGKGFGLWDKGGQKIVTLIGK